MLRVLCRDGDLEAVEYRKQKIELAEQLAALPTGTAAPDTGDRFAVFLGDVSLTWQIATPDERNNLARQLFSEVEIENRTAVELPPRPDLLPFFALASESTSVMTYWRKRRDSNPRSQP